MSTATIERFNATAHPDAIHQALQRDGVAIIENLLADDVVTRVNDEVGAALDAADPEEAMFNPVMQAFHGPCTRQVTGVCGISRTFAVDVMCNPLDGGELAAPEAGDLETTVTSARSEDQGSSPDGAAGDDGTVGSDGDGDGMPDGGDEAGAVAPVKIQTHRATAAELMTVRGAQRTPASTQR